MTFVTKLTLTSGDRDRLDSYVSDIVELVERKGAEMTGPHPHSPRELRVPQYKRLGAGGDRFSPWRYSVYVRTLEIVGHDEVARRVTQQSVPPEVHVEVEVEQVTGLGRGRNG